MYPGLQMTQAAMAAQQQQQQQQRTAAMNGAYGARPGMQMAPRPAGTPQQMMAVNTVRPQVGVQPQSAQFTSVARNLPSQVRSFERFVLLILFLSRLLSNRDVTRTQSSSLVKNR